jgi:hypothetical protein
MSSLVEKLTEFICSVSLLSMQIRDIKCIEIIFKIFTQNINPGETNYLHLLLLIWHYSPLWALACLVTAFQLSSPKLSSKVS